MTKSDCRICGEVKTGWYLENDSRCGKCINERRKQLKIERRQAKGLPPYGSGRDPKCKDCRELKEESYKNGNYCAKCKCFRERNRYAQKKESLGILSTNKKGRSLLCTTCSAEKEGTTGSYCRKCEATRQKQWRWEKKQDPKLLELYRKKNVSKYMDNLSQTAQLSREAKLACRIETRKLIFKGLLKMGACEICGTTEDIQTHHDDYTKPLEVRWLCRTHHAKHHKNDMIEKQNN